MFNYARRGKCKKYPATLRVKLSATPRPEVRNVTGRPLSVFEREVGEQT